MQNATLRGGVFVFPEERKGRIPMIHRLQQLFAALFRKIRLSPAKTRSSVTTEALHGFFAFGSE
jgi:hypothetical protein